MLINNRLRRISSHPGPQSQWDQEIQEISQHTLRAIAEVRAIAAALRPPALEQIGLTRAIEWMVERIAASSPTRFQTELECVDGILEPDHEIQFYRILQEALNNVAKHAFASLAILEVKHESQTLRMSLYDNGRGFDTHNHHPVPSHPPGLGLSTMAERAKVLQGVLHLQSEIGRGTRITLLITLPSPHPS